LAAYGIALPLVGIVYGVDTGWRVLEAEWFASSSSATSSLGGMVQRGLGIGCGLMDSHRVVAQSGAVVALMASLERAFTSVKLSRDGHAIVRWR
jgi:hypothetical protein